jgi:Asp/Glu/hydantoin racemase
MKRIVLLHTVKSVYETFGDDLRKLLGPDVIINNILDDFLADDAARRGGVFTTNNKLRLMHDLENAQMASPDVIVVTCSTLSPYIPDLRQFFTTPIISIDDALCRDAVHFGKKIAVLATAQSALQPVIDKIRNEARRQGNDVVISGACDPDAIAALKAGDRKTHDMLLLKLASRVTDADIIVLSQASMALMQNQVEALTGIKTISSPSLCQLEVKDWFDQRGKA